MKKIETVIEITKGIPSYTAKNEPVKFHDYPEIGFSVFIIAESIEEIFAEKVVAFGEREIGQSSPFKARDIWDIYLLSSLRIPVDYKMVLNKIKDYCSNFQEFEETYIKRHASLKEDFSIYAFRNEIFSFFERDPVDFNDRRTVRSILDTVYEKMDDIFAHIPREVEKNMHRHIEEER